MPQNSPNIEIGRNGHDVIAVVVHKCEGSFGSCVGWLCNKNSKVSAHYVISEEGEVTQLADEKNTAWHAGVVVRHTWKLLKYGVNPNYYTIGIELAGYASNPSSASQKHALAELIAQIAKRTKIKINEETIVWHREIRANKTCPGDWLTKKEIIFFARVYNFLDNK